MFRIQRILVLSCIFALSQTQAYKTNKKLKILVLYESLCPDSIRFFATQLSPNYDDLKDFIDIKLVPFGKAHSENNGAHFYCQHGPAECAGNKKQSCVLSQTENQEMQVKFSACAMSQPDSFDSCAIHNGLSRNIEKCINTEYGTNLQLQAEEITKLYNPKFIPTIIYDKVFDQELQDSSLYNFRGTVCRLLQHADILDFDSKPCA